MSEDLIIAIVAITAVLIIIVWRFSSGDYGRLSPSDEVTVFYESHQVDPDSSYYLSGSDDFPTAVMAINKSLTFDPGLWKAVDPTPDKMRSLVENMRRRAAEKMESLQGYDILDHRGQKIGSWYSLLGIDVMIKSSREGGIVVTTPSQQKQSR